VCSQSILEGLKRCFEEEVKPQPRGTFLSNHFDSVNASFQGCIELANRIPCYFAWGDERIAHAARYLVQVKFDFRGEL
jgi:hypothetical protein